VTAVIEYIKLAVHLEGVVTKACLSGSESAAIHCSIVFELCTVYKSYSYQCIVVILVKVGMAFSHILQQHCSNARLVVAVLL